MSLPNPMRDLDPPECYLKTHLQRGWEKIEFTGAEQVLLEMRMLGDRSLRNTAGKMDAQWFRYATAPHLTFVFHMRLRDRKLL